MRPGFIEQFEDDDASQRERLTEQLNRGILECLVCYEHIKQSEYVWSCNNCYQVLHLKCIKKWASQSENSWKCPACRDISFLYTGGVFLFLREEEDAGVESQGRGSLVRRDLRSKSVQEQLHAQMYLALPSRLLSAVRGDGDQVLRLRKNVEDAAMQCSPTVAVRFDMRKRFVVRKAHLSENAIRESAGLATRPCDRPVFVVRNCLPSGGMRTLLFDARENHDLRSNAVDGEERERAAWILCDKIC